MEESPVIVKDPFSALVDATLAVEKLRVRNQVRQTHLFIDGTEKLVEKGAISEDLAKAWVEEWEKKRVLPSHVPSEQLALLHDEETDELDKRMVDLEGYIDHRIAALLSNHPAYPWFSRVKGIGKENIGKIVGLVDIEKAATVSALWSFCGFAPDPATGKSMKRTTGTTLAYNSQLRSMCWRLATSLLRAKGKYYDFYLKQKERLEARFATEGKAIVPATGLPKKDGKRYEPDNAISEGHVHNMALRLMIKLFLSHLWLTWRQAKGLSIRPCYAIEHGHTHLIEPWDMTDR